MPRSPITGIDPAILAEFEDDFQSGKAASRSRYMPRLEIDRGDVLAIRLLPVEIGTNKSWFGKIAQHWVNKKPLMCKRHTSKHLGGDPNHDCKACAMVDTYISNPNGEVAQRADRSGPGVAYIGACLIFERQLANKENVIIGPPECWTAHEFAFSYAQFEGIYTGWKNNYRSENTNSICDFELGRDIQLSRVKAGIIPQILDPSSLVLRGAGESDDLFYNRLDAAVAEIWKTVRIRSHVFPTLEAEKEFCAKMREYITTTPVDTSAGSPPATSRSRRAPAPTDLNEDAEAEVQAAPASRSTPPAPAPAPPASRPPAQPASSGPPTTRRQPAPAAESPVEPAPAAATTPPPPTKPAASPMPSRTAPPPARRASTPAPTAPPIGVVAPEDEDDGVAPESSDLAPAATPEIEADAATEDMPPLDDAPPPPAQSSRLTNHLQKHLTARR